MQIWNYSFGSWWPKLLKIYIFGSKSSNYIKPFAIQNQFMHPTSSFKVTFVRYLCSPFTACEHWNFLIRLNSAKLLYFCWPWCHIAFCSFQWHFYLIIMLYHLNIFLCRCRWLCQICLLCSQDGYCDQWWG